MFGDEDKNLLSGYWDKLVYVIYRVDLLVKGRIIIF